MKAQSKSCPEAWSEHHKGAENEQLLLQSRQRWEQLCTLKKSCKQKEALMSLSCQDTPLYLPSERESMKTWLKRQWWASITGSWTQQRPIKAPKTHRSGFLTLQQTCCMSWESCTVKLNTVFTPPLWTHEQPDMLSTFYFLCWITHSFLSFFKAESLFCPPPHTPPYKCCLYILHKILQSTKIFTGTIKSPCLSLHFLWFKGSFDYVYDWVQ